MDGAGVGDLERVRTVCCEGLQTVSALNLQICSTIEPLLSGCGGLRFFDAKFFAYKNMAMYQRASKVLSYPILKYNRRP